MIPVKIKVGIVAPSDRTRAQLRKVANATGLAEVSLEVGQYCLANGKGSTRRFLELEPDIILVDLEDPAAAIQTLHTLHSALPESWLIVTSEKKRAQLIIRAMQAGAREFLVQPIAAEKLSPALERYIAEKGRNQEPKKTGAIYCVTAAKGGTGATSVAINLATAVAKEPKNTVALIDLDSPIGDAAAYLDVKPKFTVSDTLAASSRLDPILLRTYTKDCHGFAVLPGPKEFRPGQMPDVEALAVMLEVVRQAYTHAFVDLPSSLNEEHLRVVIELSRAMVVVLTPELPAIWRTDRLLRFLEGSVGSEKVHLVLNRSANGSDEIAKGEIEKAVNQPIFWSLPNDDRASREAIKFGRPLVSMNNSQLAHSYQELAYRLTGTERPKKRRRFLSLFEALKIGEKFNGTSRG